MHVVCSMLYQINQMVAVFAYLKSWGGVLNSVQHHKVFYKSHCVTNTLNSTAAPTTVKATEGGLLKFNNLNAFAAIFKLSSELIVVYAVSRHSCCSFRRSPWVNGECVSGQSGGILTWTHTEDLVKVSADAHLLVELGGLCQVGAGFEVRHSEDICSTFAGSWKWTKKTFFFRFLLPQSTKWPLTEGLMWAVTNTHFAVNWGFSLYKLRHPHLMIIYISPH